jgi:hypothetical protein
MVVLVVGLNKEDEPSLNQYLQKTKYCFIYFIIVMI